MYWSNVSGSTLNHIQDSLPYVLERIRTRAPHEPEPLRTNQPASPHRRADLQAVEISSNLRHGIHQSLDHGGLPVQQVANVVY